MVVVHDGVQLSAENDAVAPDGSPETANETDLAGFAVSDATRSVAPALPCTAVTLPGFESEKSNGSTTLAPLAVANQTLPAWSSAIAMTMSDTSPLLRVVNVCQRPSVLRRETPARDENHTSPLAVTRISVTRGCGSCGAL